ncbi:hypothetical protein POTOM_033899 [Populus tomentosa]|uniref:Zinc finger CCCH domain-containing protein 24 n=1 Tax=Populus tomentosa TaxID=118781 RepID=A0A8X8CNQ3_POPTO|nr:hypothetical protein POTOM_033899 [Populus tomentosa]
MNASAVSDAHRNAEINGIKNCRFVCAKAEDVIGSLLKEYLDVPQKEGGQLNASEIRDKEIAIVEVNNAPMDDVLDSSKNPSMILEMVKVLLGIQKMMDKKSKVNFRRVAHQKKGVLQCCTSKMLLPLLILPVAGCIPLYISCNPETLVANAIELCTPSPEKVEKGNGNRAWRKMSSAGLARHRVKSMPISEPFRPVKAVAVDLFPHTPHCEMVMLLERLSAALYKLRSFECFIEIKYEDDNDELRRSPGTPVFTAPECCLGLTYHGKAADTWAVGVTLYCMIVNTPWCPDELNSQLKDLLEGLLCKVAGNHLMGTTMEFQFHLVYLLNSPYVIGRSAIISCEKGCGHMGASCSHGSACKYAHGEEELRPRPDNTWDPTSERAKKAIKLDTTNNNDSKEEDEDEEIMMTDIAADGDGDGGCLDTGLSKCLVHLPRKWLSDHLRKFLSDEGILFKSAKKKKGMSVGFLSFEDAEQLKKAIEELEGRSIGNKNIKVADVIPRQFEQKIKSAMAAPQNIPQTMEPALDGENAGISRPSDAIGDGDGNNVNSTQDGSSSQAKCARDVATPLAHMPYDDQLEHKKNSIMQMLKKLVRNTFSTRNTRKACPNGVSLPEWILRSREIGGLPCELEGILESPLRNGYRNKCEFSVGYSLQGKPTVGFMLGNFREGVTAVEEPLACPNVSSVACKYASIFQEFLQQSGLPIWNRFKNTGFWRQLTVREGRLPRKAADIAIPEAHISEVMLIVQVSSVGFDDDMITNELRGLAHAFTTGAAGSAPPLPLTALVIQAIWSLHGLNRQPITVPVGPDHSDHQGLSNVAPADAPLRTLLLPNTNGGSEVQATSNVAEARIHDYISNLRFSISPTAFFQVNTLAAEKLYSLAGDWAGLGPDSLLFDICCGTGTIGLTLADRVGMVVGIEMNASAVSDAHRNAEINGIKNCRFVCAKAEDVIGSLLKEYLDVPQKEGGQLNASEIRDKEIAIVEVNNAPMDDVLDSSKNPSHDLGNGEGASGHSENDGQEIQSQLQKSCTSKEGSSSMLHFKNVVAIVDPPRGGLHPTSSVSYVPYITGLRFHVKLYPCLSFLASIFLSTFTNGLNYNSYISCNPETLVANAIELCTPSPEKVEKGNGNRAWRKMSSAGLARHRVKSMPISEPFRPVKAVAVDLFPHTPHCEMVMLLER